MADTGEKLTVAGGTGTAAGRRVGAPAFAATGNGLHVTSISRDGFIRHCWLPKVPEGRFEVPGLSQRVYIEASHGEWMACAIRPAAFMTSPTERTHRIALVDNQLVPLVDDRKHYLLFVEAAEEEGASFHNYRMADHASIRIGRSPDCDICCAKGFVSHEHAVITRNGNAWEIVDTNSANGVYVNDSRVSHAQLALGDHIYIMGLSIIVGKGFLSISDGRKDVTVNSPHLVLAEGTMGLETARTQVSANGGEEEPFSRKPRHRKAFTTVDVQIEAPPLSLNSDQIPLVLRVGGNAVMTGASAVTGNLLPLVSSLLFPVVSQKYTDQQRKEYEERRQTRYSSYLREKLDEIRAEAAREQEILNFNYPPVKTVLGYPFDDVHLWERRTVDDDFMHVRLGTATLPLRAEVKYPERRFSLDDDELEKRMYQLAETPVYLEGAPLVISLVDNYICSIKGGGDPAFNLLQRLMAQIAILHSYEEVKLVLLASEDDLAQLEYARTLPHFWDDQRSIRFIATNPGEAYQIALYLREQMQDDLDRPRQLDKILKTRPYYCVFALNKQVLDSMELLKDVMQLGGNCGMSIVTAFMDPPKDCMLLLDVSRRGRHKAVYLEDIERDEDEYIADGLVGTNIAGSLSRVANTSIRQVDRASELPLSCTFLEMFGAGNISQLAPVRRWRESDPTKSLAVPVGVAPDGSQFMLDLHEKYHGPHGLVAGSTGSGKSEFLLTYILSMAISFHPDEVAFVLIDYKGGGLAGAFMDADKGIHLPHVVGTITNLDGAAIQRSLISLEAEVKRRQHVFNKAKSIANEGTMDIYGYQKLYRKGIVDEPVPHLFIVSDEFAELKQQQPEFMDQLVSIARIGRSLGVHLILATQKPAGVVNEQIRSNAKFKVCLKVQTREDSMDMLKRPEAAELKETGRFYLQVGYNELFALGQSGWSGAPYEPSDEVVKREDDSVEFIDTVGQPIHVEKPTPFTTSSGKSQLVSIVEELTRTADEMGIRPRMLWEEALPKTLDIDGFEAVEGEDASHVNVAIGMLDDPEGQRQMPLVLDLTASKNLLIIGENGYGKTSTVQSMLLTLARRYSADRVNFYILDHSGGMLAPFAVLPHCGGVLSEEDQDGLDNFFKLLNDIVAQRKRQFREMGVASYEAACQVEPVPLVLVVVDNIAGLSATKKGDNYAYALADYIKAGHTYGVRFVVTCAHTSEISSRTRQELADRISVMQNDRYAHTDILGCRCNYIPPAYPGRGLYRYEGRPLELQCAMFGPDIREKDRLSALASTLQAIADAAPRGVKARQLPVVRLNETYEEFAERFDKGRIPLGYALEDARAVALPMRQFDALALHFGVKESREAVVANLLHAAAREGMRVFAVKGKTSRIAGLANAGCELVECNADAIYGFLHECLAALLAQRHGQLQALRQEYDGDPASGEALQMAAGKLRANAQPVMVLYENLGDVCRVLGQTEENDRASATVELAVGLMDPARFLNVHFVGCLDADEGSKTYSHRILRAFKERAMCLFFGGKMVKQLLCEIPPAFMAFNKEGVFNKALMSYRGEFHALVMPSSQPEPEPVDEDEQSIFG